MASAFATQLRTIAAKSSHELDLRARRDAHSESLIFERSVAAKQDWDTVYQLCLEGFQELCKLDGRLREFERNLFSPHAKDQDREQLNKSQNEALDVVIDQCLSLLGSRLMLRPGIRALEWLVRRFRVHVYNSSSLLLTVLPYHETPLFQNVLSIIPADQMVDTWKFLRPYHKAASIVPRHTVIYAATNNDGFFSALNNYTLRTCQIDARHSGLLRFWSSVVVEAIIGMLHQAKNGRKEVQRQRTEDVLLKVLPLLSDALEITQCTELTMACFTIAIVLASTGALEDVVLDSIMEAIVNTLDHSETDSKSVLVCLSVLVMHKTDATLSKGVISAITGMRGFVLLLQQLSGQYPVQKFVVAAVRSSLRGLKRKNLIARLDFLGSLLPILPSLNDQSTTTQCLFVVFSRLQELQHGDPTETVIGNRLVDLLQRLNDLDKFSPSFSQLAILGSENSFEVESILGTTVAQIEAPISIETDDMGVDQPSGTERTPDSALASLAQESGDLRSFLTKSGLPRFEQFLEVFQICTRQQEDVSRFAVLDFWQSPSKSSTHFISFLLKVACGPFLNGVRVAATRLIAQFLDEQSEIDSQALLPYLSSLLADPAITIRRAASVVLLSMERAAPQNVVEGEECSRIGSNDLYDQEDLAGVVWFSSSQLIKLIQQVYLPSLEECVADGNQIQFVLQSAFNGPSTALHSSMKKTSVEIKKTLRNSLFECLATHAVATPLLKIKVELIKLLREVHKVGTSSKGQALGPILHHWASFSPDEAKASVSAEGLQLSHVDEAMVGLVTAQDRDAVNRILATLEDESVHPRPELVLAFFDRVAEIWKDLRVEIQSSAATHLFDLSFSDNDAFARGSRTVFQQVTLSTEILSTLLEHASSGVAQLQAERPPQKRRRTSNSQERQFSLQLGDVSSRLALALELVHSSKPETRPELTASLFEVLLTLRRLKDLRKADSPYILNLCLSSILAIIDRAGTSRHSKIDPNAIRADLITDCVRTSENTQVQATALLVSGSLATIAPERMLHNIMPIFTFMGHNILSKEDDHSIHVINQALDQIVPPLISSLRKQNEKNLIAPSSGLLASFTAAYDHIPQHRRVSFFQRLLSRLGPDDFSFAIIAMLAMRKAEDPALRMFLNSVMDGFSPFTQLVTFGEIVRLITDMFSDTPQNAEALLHVSAASTVAEKRAIALHLFGTACVVLQNKSLKSGIDKIDRLNAESSQILRDEFRSSLHQMLETIRDRRPDGEEIVAAARKCMAALLELLPLSELFEILPALMEEMRTTDQGLQSQVLRVLAAQLSSRPSKTRQTQTAAISYLSDLEAIVATSKDIVLRQAAIACVDQIAETYGRKDIDAMVSAATTLAGDNGVGFNDERIQVMSLLSLASMLDIMKEAAVPIIPEVLPRTFGLLERGLQSGGLSPEIHNAAYTLFSAVASHVPFMISEPHLDRLLELSAEASFSDLPVICLESRRDAFTVLSRKMDLDFLTTSLKNCWSKVVENGVEAVIASLDLLSQAIEYHSKSIVVRSSEQISSFAVQAMDLRLVQLINRDEDSYTEEEIFLIETHLNVVLVKFIYKLNDTVFRPIFETWVEWAVKGQDLIIQSSSRDKALTLRQTSLFNFLAHFFSTLKSIVTSYASYIIAPANKILDDVSSAQTKSISADNLNLYTTLLTTLIASFTHDADGFFNAPSHFTPLSTNLTSQLGLAATKTFRPLITSHVIPTIVALASATLDSPSHHHTLNHSLSQLRHSSSSAVRLASIQTHLALTESDQVGDEWVNNVAGSGGAGGGGGAGETMVYVNEMLEDDDETVEAEVRRWVRMVREKVGEDVFET